MCETPEPAQLVVHLPPMETPCGKTEPHDTHAWWPGRCPGVPAEPPYPPA